MCTGQRFDRGLRGTVRWPDSVDELHLRVNLNQPCRSGWRWARTGRRCRAHSGRWSCGPSGLRGTSRCRGRRCAVRAVVTAPLLGGLQVPQMKLALLDPLASAWDSACVAAWTQSAVACTCLSSSPLLLLACCRPCLAAQPGRAGAGASVNGARAAARTRPPRGSSRGGQCTHTGAAAAAGRRRRGGGGAASTSAAGAEWRRRQRRNGKLSCELCEAVTYTVQTIQYPKENARQCERPNYRIGVASTNAGGSCTRLLRVNQQHQRWRTDQENGRAGYLI